MKVTINKLSAHCSSTGALCVFWEDEQGLRYHFWMRDVQESMRLCRGDALEFIIYRNGNSGVTRYLNSAKGYGAKALALIFPHLPRLTQEATEKAEVEKAAAKAENYKRVAAMRVRSAGPALLEALEAALDQIDAEWAAGYEPPEWRAKACAAVALARGES